MTRADLNEIERVAQSAEIGLDDFQERIKELSPTTVISVVKIVRAARAFLDSLDEPATDEPSMALINLQRALEEIGI